MSPAISGRGGQWEARRGLRDEVALPCVFYAAWTPRGAGVSAGRKPGQISGFRGEGFPAVLRARAARLPERVQAWRAKAGVAMPRVVVADQRKRWGSCDRSGTIRLNWRIIQAPMRLVDYVVVHELVHLRHRGHGRDYWRAVARVMPDYERRREELRRCGAGLAW